MSNHRKQEKPEETRKVTRYKRSQRKQEKPEEALEMFGVVEVDHQEHI